MGKLFDLVKKYVQELNEFNERQKNDFHGARKFDPVYNAYKNKLRIRALAKSIDHASVLLFGSKQNYYQFLSQIIKPETYSIPEFDFSKPDNMPNYEEIFNRIEEHVDEEKFKVIKNDFEAKIKDHFDVATHPFKEEIDKNIEYIDTLSDEDMPKAEKDEIKESLLYANEMLIKKHGDNYVDQAIDIVGTTRDKIANKNALEFAAENNINANLYTQAEKSTGILNAPPDRPELSNMVKPLLDQFHLDPNLKIKIKALDQLVEGTGIMEAMIAGEQGSKEYGLSDWFNRARTLKDELLNHINNPDASKNDKIASLRRINEASKELKNITNKYDLLMNFVKENFDLKTISLPTNIYSGRPSLDDHNIANYKPDLPEKYDFENAPYSVILNAYSQAKALCRLGNMSMDEFLENPVKSYIELCYRQIQPIDDRFKLPKETNSLGKRIAHILVQPSKPYHIVSALTMSSRNLELVTHLSPDAEDSIKNASIALLGGAYAGTLNHSGATLFNEANGLDNIKNLFALGDNEDNLLKLSDKYLDRNLNFDTELNTKYNNKIRSLANQNPLIERNRVLNILKDYFIERKSFYEDPNFLDGIDDNMDDRFNPGVIFLAAKEYFQDYLFKNNINLKNLSANDREKIIEFYQNPVQAFMEEMQNQPSVFVEANHQLETFDRYANSFVSEFRHRHENATANFTDAFNVNNNKPNGFNIGKDIPRILEDNKGGFWERLVHSTSLEYDSLVDAIKEAQNEQTASYGDYEPVKYYAKKYLDRKLIEHDPNDMNETGKRRVEFAKSVLKALNAYDENRYELHANNPAAEVNAPGIVNRPAAPEIIRGVEINNPAVDIHEPGIVNRQANNDIIIDRRKEEQKENQIREEKLNEIFHDKIKKGMKDNVEFDFEKELSGDELNKNIDKQP